MFIKEQGLMQSDTIFDPCVIASYISLCIDNIMFFIAYWSYFYTTLYVDSLCIRS